MCQPLPANPRAGKAGWARRGGQGGGQGQGAGGGAGSGTAGKPQQWLERSHYLLGDVILDPYNGHYFTMVRSKGGTSGKPPANTNSSGQNNANSAAAADDPFPTSPPSAIRDGNLLWLSFGPGGPLPAWHAGNYSIGDGFTSNGTLYRMVGFTQGRAPRASIRSRNSGLKMETWSGPSAGPSPIWTRRATIQE